MGNIALEAGRALRHIRNVRGLTLLDIARKSRGEFKPTAVAAYERAERNMTLDRFCRLCRVYEVDPARLLRAALRAADGRPDVVIDLAELETLSGPDRDLVHRFVTEIRTLRGEPRAEALAVRSGDLEVLAATSGRREGELLDALGRSLIRRSP